MTPDQLQSLRDSCIARANAGERPVLEWLAGYGFHECSAASVYQVDQNGELFSEDMAAITLDFRPNPRRVLYRVGRSYRYDPFASMPDELITFDSLIPAMLFAEEFMRRLTAPLHGGAAP